MAGFLACHHAPPPVRDAIPGTLVEFDMVRVPAGTGVRAFLIGRTELLWDAYDQFMLSGPPATDRQSAHATSRPSRPYGAPDYGWGHRGFPTISVAREGAEAFCAWLSAQTGKTYRLPTEAEWNHVAALARGGLPIDSLAWHAGNADRRAHAAGTKAPDALGLYDLFGNAAEWVTTSDGQRVTRGGSFRDAPDAVGAHARAVQSDEWNERDPQIPKSRWWLSDGPFVGFRIVRELP
jgi:formylglycine-generating enzyme required for sulfatase activity